MSSLLYRINQRIKFRNAKTRTERLVIELNMQRPRVLIKKDYYDIPEANAKIPKTGLDNIFNWFDLFVQLPKKLNGKYVNEELDLFFVFKDLKIKINSYSELYIINEIYFEQCYNINIPPSNELVIVDMGMNVGLASLFFANLQQVKMVYAYEPFEPTYHQALENFKHAPSYAKKIIPHAYGLGNEEREINVPYNPENSGTNVTVLSVTKEQKAKHEIALTIKNVALEIKSIVEKHPTAKIILKIDTEGAEYEIFESLFSEKLPENIIGFLMEWHVKGPKQLEEKLVNENFKLVSTLIEPNTGLIYAFR
jgi:FkbM family methyltransferase